MIPNRDIRNRVAVQPRPDEVPSARPLAASVEIGPAGWRDLAAVARLQRRAFRPGLAYGLPTLAVLLALPRVHFLVARLVPSQGGAVVGCAIGDRHEGQARVINLAVDPASRRRGVGTALLRALEAALPRGDVLLMVERENEAAQALYRREGYLPVGTAADYYGRGHAGIWMQKHRPSIGSPPSPPRLRV